MCVGENHLRRNWKAAFALSIVFLGLTRGKGATDSCIAGPVFSFVVPLKSFSASEGLLQALDKNMLFRDTLMAAVCLGVHFLIVRHLLFFDLHF
jgi:hypothetical protein